MDLIVLPLLISLATPSTFSTSNKESYRYPTTPDPNDTTSWIDSYSLSADTTYNAIFMHYFDEDFYTFSSSTLRSVAIVVSSPSQTANIEVYKNSTSNLCASYNSNITIDYNHFSSYLVSVGPGDTLYISVSATTINSNYQIIVNTNPNLNGVNIIKHSDGNEPNRYFGSSNLSSINYYIDSSCDVNAGYSTYTYRSAYIDAINEWNKVGSLYLNIVSNPGSANVVLKAASPSYFSNDALGVTYTTVTKNGWFIYVTYNFESSEVLVNNDYTYYGSNNNIQTYKNIVSVCFHELGHSIGLDHATTTKNFMYPTANMVTINPFNEIGDGDVASYLYIYG